MVEQEHSPTASPVLTLRVHHLYLPRYLSTQDDLERTSLLLFPSALHATVDRVEGPPSSSPSFKAGDQVLALRRM